MFTHKRLLRHSPVTRNPWHQIGHDLSDGLRWVHERAFPLTGLMLAVAVCYLFLFISKEQVPISITFAASALPTLFIMVVVLIALLTLLLLFPTVVLFVRFGPQGNNRLVDLLGKKNRNATPAPSKLIIVWFMQLIAMGLSLGMIYSKFPDSTGLGIVVLLPLLVLLGMWGIWWLLKSVIRYQSPEMLSRTSFFCLVLYRLSKNDIKDQSLMREWRQSFWDLTLLFVPGIISQLALVSFVFMIAAGNFNNSDSVWVLVAYVAIGVFALGAVQIVGAMIAVTSMKPNHTLSVVKIALISAGFVASLGILPVGSYLTEAVLQFTASGVRQRAVLSLTADGIKQFESLKAEDDKTCTKSLRILMESDGYYLVRNLEDRAGSSSGIDFIPRSIVTGIDDKCPLSHKKSDDARHYRFASASVITFDFGRSSSPAISQSRWVLRTCKPACLRSAR